MFRTIRHLGLLAVILSLATLALSSCAGRVTPLDPPPADALRVASFNVHYIILDKATGAWSVGDWERRKGPMDLAFKSANADLMAFQEMESFQRGDDGTINLARDWLLAQNPGYAAAASGDPTLFPSTQPILYRRDRLTLLDQGWFFFSDTPDVIYSRTFDGSYPAFASWAAFADRDGTRFRLVNVHFEYKSASNRRLSASLVAERVAPWIADGEKVVLVGDINARAGGVPQQILSAVGLTFLPITGSTYHLNLGLNLFGAIDHIALSPGITQIGESQVVRQKFDGVWPSDHYPVMADITLR